MIPNTLFPKTKTKMAKKIGKMIVSDSFYKEVVEETKELLREFNQDHLVNWEAEKLTK